VEAAEEPEQSPDQPELVYPEDDATALPTSLWLIWKETDDPQGDEVTYEVTICTNEEFTDCEGETVTAWLQADSLVAAGAFGASGLFLLGVVGPGLRPGRRGRLLLTAALFAAALLALACSSSSDSGRDPAASQEPGEGEVGYEVTGLESNTTYYWKVVAEDPDGNSVESDTYSFTTE
jgi:hypothetical protein